MATFLVKNLYEFSTVSKLILIRHGESIWNKQLKWAGWKDIRLSQTGIKQAKQCGITLNKSSLLIDQCYTSLLTRSIQTLNHILDQMDMHYLPIYKSWRLNQKHYGSLTGQSKIQMAQKYGQQKVAQWRRSFQIAPPPIDQFDERHPANDTKYNHVDRGMLPASEHQLDVINRVRPLWEQSIKPQLCQGKNILISAHGGSLRALIKIISDLSHEQIKQLNFPHAIPLVYTFYVKDNKILHQQQHQFIGDLDEVKAKMLKVKNQTKISQV